MPMPRPTFAQISDPARQIMPDPVKPPKRWGDPAVMILLASLVVVALGALFWARFLRKKPKNARGTLVDGRQGQGSSQAYSSSGRRRRRKRRDTHPENLGRNPTLSETGGLPPPRRDESEPPPQSPQSV